MNLLELFKNLTEEEKEELANLIVLSATAIDSNGNKQKIFEEKKPKMMVSKVYEKEKK